MNDVSGSVSQGRIKGQEHWTKKGEVNLFLWEKRRAPGTDLWEMVELPQDMHPWFVGCQFHPEFKSKPLAPHPLFSSFIAAALAEKK